MTTFVQIVERGSMTAAAEALDKSLPSVVRTLASLEETLNVRLLNRTTRSIALTDDGRRYLERCRQILADIEEAESELSSRQLEPGGHLRVTAPVMFGRMRVAPVVTAFLQHYKRVDVDLLLLDRTVNLIDEGIDVAIRIGHLSDSSMIAKQVGKTRQIVCASPEYLTTAAALKHPEDIREHNCVRFTGLGASSIWHFNDGGKSVQAQIKGAFACNQIPATIDACVAGLGIGRFFCYQVEHLLKQGKLEIVLEAFEPEALPVSVVYPHAKLVSARVKVFVDWMAQALRRPQEAFEY